MKNSHEVDRDGFRCELRYIRDKEGREVDFVFTKDGAVDTLVEAKWSDETPSRPLAYYAERMRPRRAVQIVASLKRGFGAGQSEVKCADHQASARSGRHGAGVCPLLEHSSRVGQGSH